MVNVVVFISENKKRLCLIKYRCRFYYIPIEMWRDKNKLGKKKLTKWYMLNLLEILTGLKRLSIIIAFKKKKLDLSNYEDVTVFISNRLKWKNS